MFKHLPLVFLTSISIISVVPAQEGKQELGSDSRAAWRAHIEPTEEEIAWTKIDWKPNLSSGIAAAAKSGKPILLWTMNGHPFGCT